METITSTKSTRDKGFTLVELLIVIVILGVLATVTVFAVQGITSRGEASACKADRKTVEVAVEAYYAEKGTYPTDLATLATAGATYIKTVPTGLTYNNTTGAVAFATTGTPTPRCATVTG